MGPAVPGPFGRTILEDQVRSLPVAEFVQPLQQRFHQRCVFARNEREETDPVRLATGLLLRARCERTRSRCSAEQGDEFASFQWFKWHS